MRRGYLIALILAALALPVATRAMFRAKAAGDPVAVGVPSVPPPAEAPPAPVPAVALEAPKTDPEPNVVPATAWIRVTLENPTLLDSSESMAVVYDAGGKIEQHLNEGTPQFDLGPLKPGKKAVLLFSTHGGWAPATAVVTVPERGDVALSLPLRESVPFSGVVVDASGKGVAGVELEFSLELPLTESVVVERDTTYGLGGTMGMGGGRGGSGGLGHSYSIGLSPKGFHVSHSGYSDRDGGFTLRLYGDTAVQLTLRKGRKVLKQESVIPSLSPVRLVVPEAPPEEPKK